ncbi:hypothetical protein D9742_07110 [Escherichia sp. E1V33]|nr:hypothetical protein D9742_07110 [Escherichia sp. E1V33]TBR62889.1 hypothetical protein D9735_20190 [Escherichia sp. E1S7]
MLFSTTYWYINLILFLTYSQFLSTFWSFFILRTMATDADYDTENGFERAKPERSVRRSIGFAAFWSLLFTLNLM